MILSRISCCLVIVCALALTCLCEYVPSSQNQKGETDFLTALEPIFANQPDFKADVTIILADPIRMRIARSNGKVRFEWLNPARAVRAKGQATKYYRTIVISQPGQPSLAFDPQQKTFTEMPSDDRPPAPEMLQLLKEFMKGKEEYKVVVEDAGSESLDGRQVSRLKITSQSEGSELFIYIAKDLKNLVVKLETGPEAFLGGKKISYTLSNVSLDVPDNLFEYPTGYRKVRHRTFMATFKQNTAR